MQVTNDLARVNDLGRYAVGDDTLNILNQVRYMISIVMDGTYREAMIKSWSSLSLLVVVVMEWNGLTRRQAVSFLFVSKAIRCCRPACTMAPTR